MIKFKTILKVRKGEYTLGFRDGWKIPKTENELDFSNYYSNRLPTTSLSKRKKYKGR